MIQQVTDIEVAAWLLIITSYFKMILVLFLFLFFAVVFFKKCVWLSDNPYVLISVMCITD